MSGATTITEEETRELQEFVRDIATNPFASSEIQAMGGIRAVLSDDLLKKLGFAFDGPPPPLALLNRRTR